MAAVDDATTEPGDPSVVSTSPTTDSTSAPPSDTETKSPPTPEPAPATSASAPAPAPTPEPPPPAVPRRARVVLRDGTRLEGTVLGLEGGAIRLGQPSGAVAVIPAALVREVEYGE